MKLFEKVRDHPIFICGHPKSGTTLLRAILDCHPQLVVYPDETFFFRGFVPEIRTLSIDEKLTLAKRYLLHFFESDNLNSNGDLSKATSIENYHIYAQTCEVMNEMLPNQAYRHDGDLLSAAILAFGQVSNQLRAVTKYWIEKTPYNEYYANKIFKWWPDAHCLQVVRDPRDNFATYHRKHPGLAAQEFAASWNASLEVGNRNMERFGNDRYLIIRYEDLTLHPEPTIRKITEFLGIDDASILRQPTRNGIPWEGNSMFNDRFIGISSKPLGRWKTELSPLEVKIIDMVCQKGMKKSNYITGTKFSLETFIQVIFWKMKKTIKLIPEVRRAIKRGFGYVP